ncbi:hypothetical protein TPR58_16520 [Sphingomonas sp. HF-S3]|uniref:Uncharacterized protein n=1 Tax=Sphingomonas rustica TaxID=3103142 RepID=A0ABV0BFC5_9SPHN
MSTYDPDGKRTGDSATPGAAPSIPEAADWVAQGLRTNYAGLVKAAAQKRAALAAPERPPEPAVPIARPSEPNAGDLERLPPAYAPFAPVLEALSLPLRQIIHGLLAELETTLAAFEVREFAQQGEFEGLGGLTTRGDMAHVLQSELLLRTEAPLEFLRRFAESEILYHAPQYADPGTRSLYRVMISSGPGLLGHGRIVALAALFFLARVAHERGAEFHWCYLPREEGADWFDEVSIRTVMRFLKSASYREMSGDDVADADGSWTGATPGRSEDRDPRLLDWVVGAQSSLAGARDAQPPAVVDAPNALTFTLKAPIPGTPRATDIRVRRAGRERARRRMVFPEDKICRSALEQPFDQLNAVADARPPGVRQVPPRGGQSQYLAVCGSVILIRTDWGLLICDWTKRWFGRCRYVPIEADATLVGVSATARTLLLLMHARNALALSQISLTTDAPDGLLLGRATGPDIKDLVGRGRYAIPPLGNDYDLIQFYTASGQSWFIYQLADRPGELALTIDGLDLRFAQNQYRVFVDRITGSQRLEVRKRRESRAKRFWLPSGQTLPADVLDWAWSPDESSLAFSAEANVWTIPERKEGEAAEMLSVAPCEQVLTALVNEGGVIARIWSDARYGGNGTVRELGYLDGRVVHRGPTLMLGDVGSKIVYLQYVDGGYWAVVGDDGGRPHTLIRYRRTQGGGYSTHRFPLAELRAKAVTLDPKQLYA